MAASRPPDWRALYGQLRDPVGGPAQLVHLVMTAHRAVEDAVHDAGVDPQELRMSLGAAARLAARKRAVELPEQLVGAIAYRNRITHDTFDTTDDAALEAVRVFELAWCALTGGEPTPGIPTPALRNDPADSHFLLGPWHPVGNLGAGGFGEVLLAEHNEHPGLQAAVKIMLAEHADKRSLKARFLAERNVLRDLGGNDAPAGLVRYLGSDTDDDQGVTPQWIALEYIEGMTLAECLSQGVFPDGRRADTSVERERLARDVGAEVAEAALYAHTRGYAHRDIKPRNIMLTPQGRVVLLDFGIATDARGAALTRTGAISPHTPEYAAPEVVLRSGPVSKALQSRLDVYSLGIVLLETLTGSVPDPLDGPATLLTKVENPRLRQLIAEMLDRRADHRPDMVTIRRQLLDASHDPLPVPGMAQSGGHGTWIDPEESGSQRTIVADDSVPSITTDPTPTATEEAPILPVPEAPTPAPRRPAPPPFSTRGPSVAIGIATVMALVGLGWWFLRASEVAPVEATCGNRIVEGVERCDDGNTTSGDGCSERCAIERIDDAAACGNGVLDEGETCDDGNTTAGDGCGPDCLLEQVEQPPSPPSAEATPAPVPIKATPAAAAQPVAEPAVAVVDLVAPTPTPTEVAVVEVEPTPAPDFPPRDAAALRELASTGSKAEFEKLMEHIGADPTFLQSMGRPATYAVLEQSMRRFNRAVFPSDATSDAVIEMLPTDELSCREAKVWLSWTYDDLGRNPGVRDFYARHCRKCSAAHPELTDISSKDCARTPDYSMNNGRCLHRDNLYYSTGCSP